MFFVVEIYGFFRRRIKLLRLRGWNITWKGSNKNTYVYGVVELRTVIMNFYVHKLKYSNKKYLLYILS